MVPLWATIGGFRKLEKGICSPLSLSVRAAAPASRQTAILVPLALDGRYADRPRTSVPVLLKVGMSMRPPQTTENSRKAISVSDGLFLRIQLHILGYFGVN